MVSPSPPTLEWAIPNEHVKGGSVDDCDRSGQGGAQPSDGLDGDLDGHVRVDEDELLAAEPRDDVVAADVVAQHAGEELERTVADLVAVGVVEPLELVQVGEHEDERDAPVEEIRDLGLEGPAVGEPGQSVGRGLLA